MNVLDRLKYIVKAGSQPGSQWSLSYVVHLVDEVLYDAEVEARVRWALQVLDSWRKRGISRRWVMTEGLSSSAPECLLTSDTISERRYQRDTEDAARLAAAEAVWPSLPDEERKRIGDRP